MAEKNFQGVSSRVVMGIPPIKRNGSIHLKLTSSSTTLLPSGLTQQLAKHLKAPCYALSELKAENLYHTVRDEMAKPMKK